jgi:predicted site-specific integrase-resolvase
MDSDPPQLMTAAEVCQLLHIGSSTLQDWRERGLIDGHPLPDGRSWRYPSGQPAIAQALTAVRRYAGAAQ